MEMIRTKLDALKKLAGNLGVDASDCMTNAEALNCICNAIGCDASPFVSERKIAEDKTDTVSSGTSTFVVNKIDVTNVDKITFNASLSVDEGNSASLKVYIKEYDGMPSGGDLVCTLSVGSKTIDERIVEIDTSGLTGEYQVHAGGGGNKGFTLAFSDIKSKRTWATNIISALNTLKTQLDELNDQVAAEV